MTGRSITWNDLDEVNKKSGHYRRVPDFVVNAQVQMEELWKKADDAVEAYLRGTGTLEEMRQAGEVAQVATNYMVLCRHCYHSNKTPPTYEEYLSQIEKEKGESNNG